MADFFQVFDNENVNTKTRNSIHLLGIGFAFCMAILFFIFVNDAEPSSTKSFIIGVIAPTSLVLLWFLYETYSKIKQQVWSVRISDRKIIGLDYSRKKISFDWIKVDRIELATSGLIVCGSNQQKLAISHLYTDFSELSHCIVSQAEFYEIPIFINGKTWQELEISKIYPFVNAIN